VAGDKFWTADRVFSVGKFVFGAIAAALAVVVFYFTMEMDQNDSITRVTTALEKHVEQADKTFDKIDMTMREQRAINQQTSNALTEISGQQRRLLDDHRKICRKVEDLEDRVDKIGPKPD